MYNFEKLNVWQKTRLFVNDIYKITSRYPNKEKYILTSHSCKSAISILSNLAEGGSRLSAIEQKRFIEVALGSLYEVIAQLYIALDNKYLTQKDFDNLYKQSQEISKMLNGLSSSLKSNL